MLYNYPDHIARAVLENKAHQQLLEKVDKLERDYRELNITNFALSIEVLTLEDELTRAYKYNDLLLDKLETKESK